jgi:flagellar hook-associated protein FlgK
MPIQEIADQLNGLFKELSQINLNLNKNHNNTPLLNDRDEILVEVAACGKFIICYHQSGAVSILIKERTKLVDGQSGEVAILEKHDFEATPEPTSTEIIAGVTIIGYSNVSEI